MNLKILYCFILFCSACNNKPKLLEESEDEEFYIKKFQINGKPEIMVLEYFKENESLARKYFIHEDTLYGEDSIFNYDGSIQIVRRYKNGKLHGSFVGFFENGDTLVLQEFNNGQIVNQKHFFPDGSLNTSIENNITRSFFYNKKLKMIRKFFNNKKIYGTLEFDQNGNIIEAYGNFDFLSSQDSVILNESYSNWEDKLNDY